MKKVDNLTITLDHGSGGYASWELLKEIRQILKFKGKWQNTEDDAAVFDLGTEKLVFTTDAFIIDPIFFQGGDIGKIAICGTINDLSVMGAKPLGISLSIVIEEGFSRIDLMKIISSINKISFQSGVPIVTGDTKVLEKGKIDKIEITTAGTGLAKRIIQNNGAMIGDSIIASGDLGEHTVAVLSKRFNYQTNIKSDSKPLNQELELVGKYLNACKDPTRGGLSANIVEIAKKSKVKIILDEKLLPYKKETIALSELLGIDFFSFASEGRFISSVSSKNVNKVLKILKKFNQEAKIIGRAEKGEGVFLKTRLGSFRPIEMPRGKLIPRIC
ncbi:hydrogenase expression/formation protein HypE [Patescibacteria group bacterium]|nr:hydrogenase expression/formation protein HypE [Patescibacteria group bacterium]MBU0879648.1 hydrogenase expression/formation protein HypE [Patescibacteria group bacterium]MBU0880097.1 hydrogenase expression/formation protein HypE [Patescibacteria group bacterium]MBU0897570.1 hydrogenase expression/formation protein HypE [Patescibacteria group bacterium]MBU1063156.1 hydrogenase expression/formation protein HypE [Patescibacteria group bacterium]